MKICSRCETSKPFEEFAFRSKIKGTRRSECKSCRKIIDQEIWRSGNKKTTSAEARAAKRKILLSYLFDAMSSGCVDCGETNLLVLEFDHLSDKTANISTMLKNEVSLDKLKLEVNKCEVVCANCHKIRTYTRSGNWRTEWLLGSSG